MTGLSDLIIEPVVRAALAEDLGRAGDITSNACLAPDARFAARFAAREDGVVSGLGCARLAIALMDPVARFEIVHPDGAHVRAGAILAKADANARALLAAERTALNLLCRLSGIASLTAKFVAETEGTRARIVDTRKTTPGLRALEKYAVRCGGVGEAVRRARAAVGHMVKIEVEIDRLSQLDEALAEDPDIIMLDNFPLTDMAEAVRQTRGRALLEASGGVNLKSVRAIAGTGVDLISVGALTHSAPTLDIGLDAA